MDKMSLNFVEEDPRFMGILPSILPNFKQDTPDDKNTEVKDYDEYGFLVNNAAENTKHEADLHGKHENGNPDVMTRCAESPNWMDFLKRTGGTGEGEDVKEMLEKVGTNITRSEELMQLVLEEGIPHDIRPQMWRILSGAAAKREASAISYDEIVRNSSQDIKQEARAAIEKDLCRILPNNVCFTDPDSPGICALRRVLQGLDWMYPDSGIFHGAGVITAHLLLWIGEEDAFWQMCAVVDDLVPQLYFGTNLLGAHVDQRALRRLVVDLLPDVDVILHDHSIELAMITFQWFITLFGGVLKTHVLLRVWDLFFLNGSCSIFQISIGVLKLQSENLKEMTNSADICNYMSQSPFSFDDANQLIKVAFDSTCDVNPSTLYAYRQKYRAILDQRRKQSFDVVIPEKSTQLRNPTNTAKFFAGFHHQHTDDLRSKNIRQTELVSDLKSCIKQIVNHFCRGESTYSAESSPDYESAAHASDHDHYMTVSRQRVVRAKALIDFERTNPDELGFKKNDIITITSMKDEHCWTGELNNLKGWFPSKFVEVLDERSKTYTAAGDGTVNESIADLVRGRLCPALFAIFEHGLRRPLFLGNTCHTWQFIEEAAMRQVEKDYDSVISRLVLCKTFRLDEDGKVLTPEELLYRCVEAVNYTHNSVHAQMDVKFRSLICYGLNEQCLHLWLETLCLCEEVANKWYHPWSFVSSPGWVQIKCELRVLSNFTFYLPPDAELPKQKQIKKESFKQDVCDMLVKHHLFSWDL